MVPFFSYYNVSVKKDPQNEMLPFIADLSTSGFN